MREITWPDPIDGTSRPSIRGTRRSPEPVGLAPFTVWKKSGRNVIAPNSAKPTINPIPPATENTRLGKSPIGSTGPGAGKPTVAKQPHGRHGFRRAPLEEREQDQKADAGRRSDEQLRRVPGPCV